MTKAKKKTSRAVYCTSYCNRGHYLDTGAPVGHECRRIPPKALQLERQGDIEGAIAVLYSTRT